MGEDFRTLLHRQRYGHLPRRHCTKASPMLVADKDRFYWLHDDAAEVGKFFNLIICVCPNCKLRFTCFPK